MDPTAPPIDWRGQVYPASREGRLLHLLHRGTAPEQGGRERDPGWQPGENSGTPALELRCASSSKHPNVDV